MNKARQNCLNRRTILSGEYRPKVVKNIFCEYAASVFRHKDQMHKHHKNAVSSNPNIIVVFAHRIIKHNDTDFVDFGVYGGRRIMKGGAGGMEVK